MIIFIDYKNHKCYIASCKCGNTTIAAHLKLPLHTKYSNNEIVRVLRDADFQKIIIIRDILDRFYSGFCEDIKNNTCYENIHISFYEYCLFLKHCYDNKLKNVNNINAFYKKSNVPIWWGNCGNKNKPITNSDGQLDGHIISQYNSIINFVNIIKDANNKMLILDINNLTLNSEIKNKKTYSNTSQLNYDSKLSEIKNYITDHKVFPNKNKMYNKEIICIINDIYKQDYEFIESLKNLN